MRRKSIAQESGLTISEVLVTIVVTSIMVGGIANIFISITTAQRRTQQIEFATRSATQKIESLRNEHYNSLTPGTTIDFSSELPDEIPLPRSGTVEIIEPQPGLRRLNVNVTFYDNTQNRQVELTAIIGSIGIAQ